jgi:DNA repair exonuclease SbcCD ATPase subunit
MQKSVIDEIRELKAQVESKTEQAKAEALESGREAINFLRELGIDNDTILKELGFRARTKSPREKAAERTSSNDEPCPICGFRTDPPHDGRSHRGQSKKRPFTTEDLAEKGLTKF